MTPLPALLGGSGLLVWRLDLAGHAGNWDSGEGAYRVGGRWNSCGVRAVYCSIDPATAILEVAVHKGFRPLDTVAHILSAVAISDGAAPHVVWPDEVPNANWLRPGIPSAGQQGFGDALLAQHRFVVLPSVVSPRSWNVVFVGSAAAGSYALQSQERFALDPRLHPPNAPALPLS